MSPNGSPTHHWALTNAELERLVEGALPALPAQEQPLIQELLHRFNLLTDFLQDDFR